MKGTAQFLPLPEIDFRLPLCYTFLRQKTPISTGHPEEENV
jgi:hypothetical protein